MTFNLRKIEKQIMDEFNKEHPIITENDDINDIADKFILGRCFVNNFDELQNVFKYNELMCYIDDALNENNWNSIILVIDHAINDYIWNYIVGNVVIQDNEDNEE